MLRNASTSPNSPRKETFGPLACAVGKSYRTARSRTPNSRTGTRWWLTRLKAEVDLPFRMDAQSLCTLKRQHTPLNPASSVFILIETWMWSRHPCPRPLVSVLQQATSHTIFFFFFFWEGVCWRECALIWCRYHSGMLFSWIVGGMREEKDQNLKNWQRSCMQLILERVLLTTKLPVPHHLPVLLDLASGDILDSHGCATSPCHFFSFFAV